MFPKNTLHVNQFGGVILLPKVNNRGLYIVVVLVAAAAMVVVVLMLVAMFAVSVSPVVVGPSVRTVSSAVVAVGDPVNVVIR
jgi:hypothetical protein